MPVKKVGIIGILCYLIFFISCKDQGKIFESLSPSKTNITFINHLPQQPNFNILYYLYYYEGGGVATGDINNDGLPDIYFTANTPGNNKLYINKGNFEFEDITAKAGVAGISDWCSGVTMADVNADGWLDLYVCAVSQKLNLKGHNQLFINNHDGTFTDKSAEYGLDFSCYSAQAVFFDYDHDGDLDCYLLNESDRPNQNIVDTSHRRKYDTLSGDKLLRNDLNTATKKFTDVSVSAGIYQSNLGYGLGLAVSDLNNDGWEDIYVGNDFHENDYYYVNNGDGTFTESGAEHFHHYSRFSMGNDIADYNNDGQLDVITADMLPGDEKILKTYGSDENPDIYNFKVIKNGFQYQYSKNCLQRNNGNGGSFSETSLQSGIAATDWSWSPLLADFDNDGNKDLFISSGIVKRTTDLDYVRFVSNAYMQKQSNPSLDLDAEALEKMPEGSSHPFLYKGDGNLSFKDVSSDWGTGNMKGFYNGAAYADLDNDGNLDLVINCIDAPAVVLKNNAPKKNYISISFKGDALNTFGIGSKAYVFQKGKSDSYRMQYQQLMLTRGFQSSSDTRLHFGLDSTSVIDSILIVWPDQKYQVLKNVQANKQITVQQKNASGTFIYADHFKPAPLFLNNISDLLTIPWKHEEDNFFDYNVQYLIPHAESTRGPKIATADVNGDGLDDLYACGSTGHPGALMIQQKNGSFIQSDTATFAAEASCEDVDAAFFDANSDGYPDLYVVSGGNEYSGNNVSLADRLYINDGKGYFARSVKSLPLIFQNKSCVTIADVDHDGDSDIFIGTLADANAFGIPQTSYLLLNDGKGHFTIANEDIISLKNIGLVTCATFADINNDGWKDLIVAGEWMPITIFINKKGKFTKSIIPNSTGLWQTVFADDVNGDGNIDFFAGNWGWNNKFWIGKDGPLNLYVHDFDANGKVEQLLSYFSKGKEYPFLPKDEVERPLPLLKKHYLSYSEYAGVEMKDVFYGWIDTVKPYHAERLGSAICYGDGKGSFTIEDLPPQLQLSPIFTFQKMKTPGNSPIYISGGNFFDVIPYEGRYDAQPLALFRIDNNIVNIIPQINLSDVEGQVRDLKWLHSAKYGDVMTAARNNDEMVLFGIKKLF
ncbi:MAG: VCBS repeat-containing protein [Ginsengibacter sp.]